MLLGELLDVCDKKYAKIEISGIAFDTAQIKNGSLFFALKGVNSDGHDFIGEAKRRGAAAAVVEHKERVRLPQICVGDARSAFAYASKRFYCNAADGLVISAVTGTNGKTTVTYMLKSILEHTGKSVGLIGTNEITFCGKTEPAKLTTPDPDKLHAIFSRMKEDGVSHVVMEASAHALALKKTDGINFAVGAFTNFTRDHLDFFGDMENYKQAKMRLFSQCGFACVNNDAEFVPTPKCETVTYGLTENADIYARNVNMTPSGSSFDVCYRGQTQSAQINLTGKFNIYNALCAVGMALGLGVSLTDACNGLAELKSVSGRFNVFQAKKGAVIVDFAHTDDGLANLISAVREITSGSVITVFGCGGNRDKTKRPVMGNVAGRLSDCVIVTSDNSRYENPNDIISDIMQGITASGIDEYYIEPDRRKAIAKALGMMKEGDSVVVAGKGAENYQEIRGVKYPYSDIEFIKKAISENNY